MKAWLNGSVLDLEEVRIAPDDRGFLLSDGLFETMKAVQSRILHLDEHLQRLRHGLSVLKIPLQYQDGELSAAVDRLLEANGLEHASLRLTVTRGGGPRGLMPPSDPSPTVLLTCFDAGAAPMDLPAAQLVVSPYRRNEGSPLSRLKVLNYLDNIMAQQKAKADGYDDALLLNNAGRLACATMANIFLLIDDEWVTPPVSDGVLPGITRRAVLDFAQLTEQPIREVSVTEEMLARADAAFLTNSLMNIRPVASINGRALSGHIDEFLPEGMVF